MKIFKLCKLCKTFWTIFKNCIPCRKQRTNKGNLKPKAKDISGELLIMPLPKFYWTRKRKGDRDKQRLRLVKQLKRLGKKLRWH